MLTNDPKLLRKISAANTSPRQVRLSELESYARGRQYDGLPSWWSEDVPLWERAPCIVYPIAGVAAQSNVDLCFPAGELFAIDYEPSGDVAPSGIVAVNAAIAGIVKCLKFAATARAALYRAQITGTACAINGVRNGLPFCDLLDAKSCTPEYNSNGILRSVFVRYLFHRTVRNGAEYDTEIMIYRRLINETDDIVYLAAPASDNGVEPELVPDESVSGPHGIGFCPVVWFRFQSLHCGAHSVDGDAIHTDALDEIRALDIARSQWHRGALYSEPQVVEIGVESNEPTGAMGRVADGIAMSEFGGEISPYNKRLGTVGGRSPAAKKSGPGHIWNYPQGATVSYLTAGEGALSAQSANYENLRATVQDILAVVQLDPLSLKFASSVSGKSLEALRKRQTDRCSVYRVDFAEGFVTPVIAMHLEIMRLVDSAAGYNLKIANAASSALGNRPVSPLDVIPRYLPFFGDDIGTNVAMLAMARDATSTATGPALITKAVAVRFIAKIFGATNPDQMLIDLAGEDQQATDRRAQDLTAEAEAFAVHTQK